MVQRVDIQILASPGFVLVRLEQWDCDPHPSRSDTLGKPQRVGCYKWRIAGPVAAEGLVELLRLVFSRLEK